MLPQSAALEFASADNLRGKDETGSERRGNPATVVQHGRGETREIGRNPLKAERSGRDGDRSLTARQITASQVFVLDKHGNPLMPCSPARTRKLLKSKRARIHRLAPFVIRLVDRDAEHSEVAGVEIGIDPGSKATGISVFRASSDTRVGLVAIELQHRGQYIHKKLQQRSGYRRGRRSRNLRYRSPRFNNRTKSKGWSAPSLQHRVDSAMSLVTRLRKWTPVTGIHQELVRFDMQKMQNSEISGVEYRQGTLQGYEVREYLLEKWQRKCAYCEAADVPLNIDHIQPKIKGGSNRVSNLTLACIPCNESKDNLDLKAWLASRFAPTEAEAIAKRVLALSKAPLKDAAAVNSTRWALYHALQATGLPVRVGTGGQTKWNRSRTRLAKSHILDAICVGQVNGVVSYPSSVIIAKAAGRRTYSRTVSDKSGFPRLTRPRIKCVQGFQTGDLVRAVVPSGKKMGTHVGRVAVRRSCSFNITTKGKTLQGISHRHCTLLQRGDGWGYEQRKEVGPVARVGLSLPTAKAGGFSSHTHSR
ncbi:MAG: HNH endonuclease [Acidimicrobiaceae bacterium]|nr:HNH endonuclease [Acidimicrobiaceae bacterium]